MANKNFWLGMLILALVFETALIGCDNGTNAGSNNGGNSGSVGGSKDITYTVEADGTADKETSSKLTFTFSAEVSGLEVGDIKIIPDTGTGAAAINVSIKENLIGDETNTIWTLSITRITAGTIRLQITKDGVERGRKTVLVHQNTSPALTKDDAIKLTGGKWEDGTVIGNEVKWYKFEAESDVSYSMQWKDTFNKSASEDYTGWLDVFVYQSDGTTTIPTSNGNPREISGVSGTVYFQVTPYRGLGGTYAIRFYESASMPQVIIKAESSARATIVPFVALKWFVQPQSEEINKSEVAGFRVYRSNTKTGKYTQIGEDFIPTDFELNSYVFYDVDKIIYYDMDVTAGNTYWYKIAAYNSKGMEGDMSDPIESEPVPGPTETVPLTIGEKIDSAMDTEYQVVWYTFEAESEKTYRVQWECFSQSQLGSWEGDYAGITVSAFTNDREIVDFTERYSSGYSFGWFEPGTVSGVSGTVYLKLETNSRTGPYNIKVYTE